MPSANAMIQPITASAPCAHDPKAVSSQHEAGARQPFEQPEQDHDQDHEKGDGEPHRLEQHRAKRRREHLIQCLEYCCKHRVALRAEPLR